MQPPEVKLLSESANPTLGPAGVKGILRYLADVPEGDEVASALAEGFLLQYQVHIVYIYLGGLEAETLHLVGQYGMQPESVDTYREIPLSVKLPGVECYKRVETVYVPLEELLAEYPLANVYGQSERPNEPRAVCLVPIVFRGRPIGIIGVEFGQLPAADLWQLRTDLESCADSLCLWLLALRTLRDHAGSLPKPAGHRSNLTPLRLTARQRQILDQVRQDRTNPQIARSLGYSEATIKAELRSLYTLLGAGGRKDLVVKAETAGL